MQQRTNERKNERTDGQTNRWTNKQMDERTDGRTNRWTNELMNRLTNVRTQDERTKVGEKNGLLFAIAPFCLSAQEEKCFCASNYVRMGMCVCVQE